MRSLSAGLGYAGSLPVLFGGILGYIMGVQIHSVSPFELYAEMGSLIIFGAMGVVDSVRVSRNLPAGYLLIISGFGCICVGILKITPGIVSGLLMFFAGVIAVCYCDNRDLVREEMRWST